MTKEENEIIKELIKIDIDSFIKKNKKLIDALADN